MTEVQFAKQFLTTLDSKATRYQADHVFDPQTFQVKVPYTLPRLAHPPHPLPQKPASLSAPAPGSEPASAPGKTIDLTLRSTRNPTFALHVPALPSTTQLTVLKAHISSLLAHAVPQEKIKILYNKKPIPANKSTVYEVLGDSAAHDEAEFGVLVMGGAPDPSPTEQTLSLNNTLKPSTAETDDGPGSEKAAMEAQRSKDADTASERETSTVAGQTGSGTSELLSTPAFWDDLQGFLEQRLKSSAEASRLRRVFETAARS